MASTPRQLQSLNHAFLLQVHKEPQLLARILERWSAPNHFFLINVDSKTPDAKALFEVVSRCDNVVHVSCENVMHGGFSMVACTIKQLLMCRPSEIKFDYFHTMSGQDYPCVSNAVFDGFFDRAGGKSFMVLDSSDQAHRWREDKYKRRLEQWNFVDVFNGPLSRKLHVNGVVCKLLSPIRRPYPDMDSVWGGWNWFSLHREAVSFLLDYFENHPEYVKRFHNTLSSDELIYQSVLYRERVSLNIDIGNSLRFVEWHPTRDARSLPLVLEETEYDDIVESGALICRKVETRASAKLLDMLDLRIQSMSDDYVPNGNPKLP